MIRRKNISKKLKKVLESAYKYCYDVGGKKERIPS
jgi:hypothetical protein